MDTRKWTQDEIDDDQEHGWSPEDDYNTGEECGRWRDGALGKYCSKAGSEECDWECPIGYAATLRKKKP